MDSGTYCREPCSSDHITSECHHQKPGTSSQGPAIGAMRPRLWQLATNEGGCSIRPVATLHLLNEIWHHRKHSPRITVNSATCDMRNSTVWGEIVPNRSHHPNNLPMLHFLRESRYTAVLPSQNGNDGEYRGGCVGWNNHFTASRVRVSAKNKNKRKSKAELKSESKVQKASINGKWMKQGQVRKSNQNGSIKYCRGLRPKELEEAGWSASSNPGFSAHKWTYFFNSKSYKVSV